MNRYLRAISTNFVFFAISAVFFVVATPIIIRVMGEEFYGLWTLLSAFMLLSNIGNLGIDSIVMKFASEAPQPGASQGQAQRVMTAGYVILFVMSVIMTASLLLTRDLITSHISTNVELGVQFRQAMLWIALSIFPQFMTRVPHGYLLSQLRNREARQLELFSTVSLWTGAAVIAILHKNLASIGQWCLFSNLLVFAFYFRASQRLLPFHVLLDTATLAKMLHFSGFMFLESLAITLFQQFDKVIVGFTLGPIAAGGYSVGTSLALRLSMVTGQATEVMIPYASLQESLDNGGRLYTTFRQLSRYVSLLLAAIGSFLIIWMDRILAIWISPDYSAQYANGFRVLVIAYGLLSLCRPAHQTLTGTGKVKFTSIVYLLSTGLMLLAVFLFSSRFGFLGAAASNLILATLLIFNFRVYSTYESPMQWKHAFADLKWAVLLPILVYVLGQFVFPADLLHELIQSLFLAGLFTGIVIKDASAKAGMLQALQSVLRFGA